MDIYCVGEMVIDFLPGSEPDSYIRKAGGAPANVAIAVVKNGLKSGMCCSVGDDDHGRFLINTLTDAGVEVLKPELCRQAVTTMVFVSLTNEGERSFTFARKPGADMFLHETDVKDDDITRCAIVHGGSCSLSEEPAASATEKALIRGQEMHKLVSFDVNYRNRMWDDRPDDCIDRIKKILPYVDLLKVSDEEAMLFGGEETLLEWMGRYNIRLVAETLGADGVKCFFDGKVFDIPGCKVQCVDTTGAGDAFWGGFLSRLRLQGVSTTNDLSEEIVRNALEYGNAAGALCVQKKGAIAALPTREEIEAFLQ